MNAPPSRSNSKPAGTSAEFDISTAYPLITHTLEIRKTATLTLPARPGLRWVVVRLPFVLAAVGPDGELVPAAGTDVFGGAEEVDVAGVHEVEPEAELVVVGDMEQDDLTGLARVVLDGPRVAEQLVSGIAVDAFDQALDRVFGERVEAEELLAVTEAEVP